MESSSLTDVIGNRVSAAADEEPEETKEAVRPVVNPAELNDISQGEFRIEAIRMKDAEAG